jgi:hypothetical protein
MSEPLTSKEQCNCPQGSYWIKHTAGCYERKIERLQRRVAELEEIPTIVESESGNPGWVLAKDAVRLLAEARRAHEPAGGWAARDKLRARKMTNRELAEKLSRAIFMAPYGCGDDKVIRIAFRGGTDRAETDMGGFCEGALTDYIEETLDRLSPGKTGSDEK